jgi:magnesium transporter
MPDFHTRGLYRAPDGSVNLIDNDEASIRRALADKGGVLWVDLHIRQPSDGRILTEVFGFHPLAVEDASEARLDPPKVDDYGDYLFIVLTALTHYEPDTELEAAEVDFFLGPNYVVSCHQAPVPAIEAFHARCLRDKKVLAHRADWVLHGMLDAMVDEFLPIVDAVDETIDQVEAELLDHQERGQLERILMVKRNTLRLRRATGPQRDIMNRLSRGEFDRLIAAETAVYFRDVYDHLVRMEYLVEAVRDLADGALQTYLSVVSNRLNEVMKVLTAAATIFLPLTLISGVYGMNFEENQFPPFDSSWGFPVIVTGMLLIAAAMTLYYKYRRWL